LTFLKPGGCVGVVVVTFMVMDPSELSVRSVIDATSVADVGGGTAEYAPPMAVAIGMLSSLLPLEGGGGIGVGSDASELPNGPTTISGSSALLLALEPPEAPAFGLYSLIVMIF
jgi:hypothetical protein